MAKNLPTKIRTKFDYHKLPPLILNAGDETVKRFLEFFAATIRNKNTRMAYAQALGQFFTWCEENGFNFYSIEPITVAAYIEQHPGSSPTKKQHLTAIRMLFNYFVINQIVSINPAQAVKGPKHVVKKGKTPVLTAEQTRKLIDSIERTTLIGLRDRALIGVMVYTFGRVSAVVNMKVGDFYKVGSTYHVRLHEKGGKFHQVPLHSTAIKYLKEYISLADIASEKKSPLFRSFRGDKNTLTKRAIDRIRVFSMIKRRCHKAGLPETTSCHTFRATGITTYLLNGGSVEHAQQIANHESPRTTKLYDRRNEKIEISEIQRIKI